MAINCSLICSVAALLPVKFLPVLIVFFVAGCGGICFGFDLLGGLTMDYSTYYPEMGAKVPNSDIEAKICIYPSGHYRLKTRLELRGRSTDLI